MSGDRDVLSGRWDTIVSGPRPSRIRRGLRPVSMTAGVRVHVGHSRDKRGGRRRSFVAVLDGDPGAQPEVASGPGGRGIPLSAGGGDSWRRSPQNATLRRGEFPRAHPWADHDSSICSLLAARGRRAWAPRSLHRRGYVEDQKRDRGGGGRGVGTIGELFRRSRTTRTERAARLVEIPRNNWRFRVTQSRGDHLGLLRIGSAATSRGEAFGTDFLTGRTAPETSVCRRTRSAQERP